MKVIFLDIDGVLNTDETFINIYKEFKNTGNRRIEIDEFRVEFLSKIIKITKAKVVLSSSWRIFFNEELKPVNNKSYELLKLLNKYDIGLYSKTDYLGTKRESEIDKWLLDNNNIENFIIFDDESFDLKKYENNKLIKTNKTGLCYKHINLAINMLNKKGE